MKKSKKPKYKLGAVLKQNAQPISQVTSLAGSLLNTEDPAGAAASGALQGAAAGASFGPLGALGGAAIGGITSLLGAEDAQRRKKEMEQQRQNAITAQLISNAGNAYAKGGKINAVSSKLAVIQGGELEPISKDAVEVKANNPNQTDSVELENAFVDHNEVIDRKNRVFSDELGFAKLAKKLEKQKSPSSRFSASNERIEQQLDDLFQQQESMKKGMKKGGKYKMLTGGELTEPDPKKPISRITNQPYKDPVEYTRQQYLENNIPSNEEYVLSYFKRNPKANRVVSGTVIGEGGDFPNQVVDAFDDEYAKSTQMNPKGDTAVYMKNEQLPATDKPIGKLGKKSGGRLQLTGAFPMKPMKQKMDVGGELFKNPLAGTKESYFKDKGLRSEITAADRKFMNKTSPVDMSKGLTTAATFAPNLVSAVAQRNLKGPAVPQLESTTRLERMSAVDQLANADRQGLLADQLIKNNTAQGADIASATGNILAKKLASKNQIYGENQRINAAIQGQEAALNTQIRARNTERMNDFNNASNEFSNLRQKLTTDNVANLSSKILQQGREKNQIDLDKFKIKYLERKFKDSGVPDRGLEDFTNEEKDKYGLKKGGKIHIKPENRGKFNATKKRTGKSTEELTHSKNPVTKKRAIFAQNASKWNKK